MLSAYIFLWTGIFCKDISSSSWASLSCLDTMEPKGKAPAPTPPYRQDANKGFLPSNDLPHAGPEPSGYALRSFRNKKSLDSSKGAFSLEAAGMEYDSDPGDNDDSSICRLSGNPSPHPL